MSASSQSTFPTLALDWLIGTEPARILALGRTCAPLMPALAAAGHRLTANDPDPSGVRRLLAHAPRALPTVSDAQHLPFVPCAFDSILVNQSLHTLDLQAALPELARVLRPGAHLAVAYTIRDDSVPWVRRLVALMRAIDPEAMTGDYGSSSVDAIEASPYFATLERKNFRLWTPISRGAMLTMVANRFPDLDDDRRDQLLADVAALYDGSARRPEPLLLPYQVACWRALVDHREFTHLDGPDDGLPITL